MEIFNQKNNQNEPYNRPPIDDEEQSSIFPRRVLNFSLPLWEKILFFIMGFLGLQLVSILIQLILLAIPSLQEDSNLLLSLLNFFTYFIVLIAFGILMIFDHRKTYIKFLHEFRDAKAYKFAFIGFAFLIFINYLFGLIYSFVPIYGSNSNQEGIEAMTLSQPALLFFTTVVFAPIVEELTYRVGLGDSIASKTKPIVAIILSSVVFGLIHFDFSSISTLIMASAEEKQVALELFLNELMNLPIYISSGAILCSTYFLSGKLSSSICCHIINNLFSFIILFI